LYRNIDRVAVLFATEFAIHGFIPSVQRIMKILIIKQNCPFTLVTAPPPDLAASHADAFLDLFVLLRGALAAILASAVGDARLALHKTQGIASLGKRQRFVLYVLSFLHYVALVVAAPARSPSFFA
jgi:hypothetical protein